MSRQANATLIGAFVFGALLLSTVTVMLLAGGTFLQERRQHIVYFEGAAQGLQIGAPVMFLGVKVGRVSQIQIGLDERNQRFLVPVTIEIEPNTVRSHSGEIVDLREHATMRQLVERGLRARLRMQSLLTGQLYVDLDFHPERPLRFFSTSATESEIPAIPTQVQEIANRLESFQADLFLADLAAISGALKTVLSDPATGEIPARMKSVLSRLESLAARLESETQPTLRDLRANLPELGHTLQAVQVAMDRVGTAADRVATLADPDGTLLGQWTRASGEIQAAAQALASLAADESPALVTFNDALKEITKAARALRTLAESLERHPEALLRGRTVRETAP
jgi:paraquat-inducible protein B